MTPRPTILALTILACTPQASSSSSSSSSETSDTTTEAPPCDDGPARALS